MNGKRQCSSCGRQLEENYQFCPFDGTPLGTKCPSCGRMWDNSYRFCPLDSTALSAPAAAAVATPPEARTSEIRPAPSHELEEVARSPQPPPPVAAPEPPPKRVYPPRDPEEAVTRPQPAAMGQPAPFAFIEQTAKSGWRATLRRPVTWLFALGVVATGFAVWYLNWRTSGPDLPPPTISYILLANEGKTKGVPVAIKVNQLTVFLIDDPMETPEGAARAKKIVAALDETIRPLSKGGGEVRFAVETVGGRPALVVVTPNGPEPRPLAMVTEGDMTLAGEANGEKVAAAWAERLMDAVKVFVLGEAPNFSTETEFGQALLAMYKAAAGTQHGKLSKKTLDSAFEHLSAAQRRALEAPPAARKTSS